ncbi:MAG: amidohydrolase family protein [Anaerolineae bacterium]|nr:amidohydrolase family protein [Anaerolineae bacterium]
MTAFDANLVLGQLGWRPVGVDSAEQMLRSMDRFGIERGLVSHLTACMHEPEAGNRALFDAVAGHAKRLLPVPVVDLNDGGRWRARVEEWTELGVRAVRIAPAFYRNRLDGDEASALAEAALARGWPVVVALNTARGVPWAGGQPNQALELAQRFPELKVLMVGANRSQWYEIIAALRRAPNLYLELSNLETGLALEQLVQTGFGPRVLNGSNYGISYANVCMERIRCASVDDRVKHAVLCGNALSLLGEPDSP